MRETLRASVIPVYILLCIVLGGSAQGMWGNLALQLIGLAIIGWSVLRPQLITMLGVAKTLFAMAALTFLLIVIQLIPLPPELWITIPGRSFIAEGYMLLGQDMPWLPVSLTPYATMGAALSLLPPVAVLSGMVLAGAYRSSWLMSAILVGTLAAVMLGALQVASPVPTDSPWYPYRQSSFGLATGFFANTNHMATLLVIALAFLLALLGELRERTKNPLARSLAVLLAVAGALVLLVGIVLNGSLAVILLGLPVLMFSSTMLMPTSVRLRFPLAALALLSIAAILVVYLTPLQDRFIASNATSFNARQGIWSNTVPAIKDNWALGSGISSFPKVYPRYEEHSTVDRTHANHAHNDYLEIVLETGLPGTFLLIFLLLWWGNRTLSIWQSAEANRYSQAATIASAAMLVHSFVDFPLRTAALSAIMAACLVLIALPRKPEHEDHPDLWPTRHVAI